MIAGTLRDTVRCYMSATNHVHVDQSGRGMVRSDRE